MNDSKLLDLYRYGEGLTNDFSLETPKFQDILEIVSSVDDNGNPLLLGKGNKTIPKRVDNNDISSKVLSQLEEKLGVGIFVYDNINSKNYRGKNFTGNDFFRPYYLDIDYPDLYVDYNQTLETLGRHVEFINSGARRNRWIKTFNNGKKLYVLTKLGNGTSGSIYVLIESDQKREKEIISDAEQYISRGDGYHKQESTEKTIYWKL